MKKFLGFMLLSFGLNANPFIATDNTVEFSVNCVKTSGEVKVKLIDTAKARNLIITSLNHSPMVSNFSFSP